MLKKLFGKSKPEKNYGPKEPIFPVENFTGIKITDENGFFGTSIVNKGYENYNNKKYFPWCAQTIIEYQEKNENGFPIENEMKILEEIEKEIEGYLKKNHTVHFIGRVTRKDYRDLIFYIDFPRFDQNETNKFLDKINSIRKINFTLEKDPEWNFVSELLEK